VAWLACYALFLASVPFEHHDLLCDLKTPQHCTSCTASVVGSDPSTPTTIGIWTLTDVGRATAAQFAVHRVLLSVRSSGRSPPRGSSQV
jgi:hypothetical protein